MTSPQRDRRSVLSPSIVATMSDEEYTQAFREDGWGEHAIQIELDRLHAFRERHDIHGLPLTRDVLNAALQPPPVPPPPPPEQPPEHNLLDALQRSLRRRTGAQPDPESPAP